METKDRYMIFGAGTYGKLALEQVGSKRVDFFIDNNKLRQGGEFCGIKIISVDEAYKKRDSHHVIVASTYAESMAAQLRVMGFSDFSLYLRPTHRFYETDELIVNPYDISEEASSESAWSESAKMLYARSAVNEEVATIYGRKELFNHIEIETINRCNGSCSFCPVNHKDDPREKAVMTWDMFESIVSQLEEIQYSGRFTTFSNNEPLLDERIIEWNQYARKHLPNARMHLYSNGTLMTLDKFKALVEVLDELIIDNYQKELKLIKPCLEIQEYCRSHPELTSKVTIVLRKPDEILTSRGGNAPNRKELVEYPNDRCALPFKQMIIRPTGQVSLCCNDAIGKFTLGDLNKERLLDIWYGPRFQMVRKCLYEGRKNWGSCKYCDTFNVV